MVAERRKRSDASKKGARSKVGKPSKGRKSRRSRPPKRRWLRWLLVTTLKLSLILGALGALGITGVFWYYGRGLPSVAQLRSYQPPQTTRVVDRDGDVVGEVFTERRTVVPMDRIPRVLVLSVLAAEDADFYQHEGMDYPGMIRALIWQPLMGRRIQGASTITQQVIKLLLLSSERTVERKVRELILARRLEQELTKNEILHLYLNHINFGDGRYGVQEAAQYYFGKDVEDLTLAEATLIAGVPQAPARLSPRRHPEAARRRQRFVLSQLEAKRGEYWPDLDLEQIQAARDTEVEIIEGPARRHAPEVLIHARQTLRELVGDDAFERGGYTVHTTIDLDLQAEARTALRRGLETIDERQGFHGPLRPPRRGARRALRPITTLRVGPTYTGVVTSADDDAGLIMLDVGGHSVQASMRRLHRFNPDELSASQFAHVGARPRVTILELGDGDEPATAQLELGPQGAAVLIEPRNRDILALIGGYENHVGFNRATQARRQPGSTFKPIVYALGIRQRRYTPASILVDAPAVYDEWRPRNYETWNYQGDVRLREALARSINLVAIRVIEELTPERVVRFANSLGIQSDLDPSLALSLGASEALPVEMVNAFATFAAGGRWAPPRLITRIVGPDGAEIELPEPTPPRDVMTPAEAYIITSMLRSVVTSGTARAARRLPFSVAGKTGTSNEARDAWFIGYSAERVAGVWVGFDDRRPLGRRESGGRSALPIWVDLMRRAHGSRRPPRFAMPSGVTEVAIDPANGLLAYEGMEEPLREVFLAGTEPTESSRPPDVVDPSTFLMEDFEEASPEAAPAEAAP